MDPDANLAELRKLVEVINAPVGDDGIDPDDAARMAELVAALDGWLTGGGVLPRAWKRRV